MQIIRRFCSTESGFFDQILRRTKSTNLNMHNFHIEFDVHGSSRTILSWKNTHKNSRRMRFFSSSNKNNTKTRVRSLSLKLCMKNARFGLITNKQLKHELTYWHTESKSAGRFGAESYTRRKFTHRKNHMCDMQIRNVYYLQVCVTFRMLHAGTIHRIMPFWCAFFEWFIVMCDIYNPIIKDFQSQGEKKTFHFEIL